jgi:hypothetical protein
MNLQGSCSLVFKSLFGFGWLVESTPHLDPRAVSNNGSTEIQGGWQ